MRISRGVDFFHRGLLLVAFFSFEATRKRGGLDDVDFFTVVFSSSPSSHLRRRGKEEGSTTSRRLLLIRAERRKRGDVCPSVPLSMPILTALSRARYVGTVRTCEPCHTAPIMN
ncbi:hypothetical protein GW17_00016567 [Ensete ventricosum]|nr:hypothetical protein GW17_00016567 [Ensete ventricosum]RZR84314.1 hypothetical protein BHM03_00011104 [Ensete ventricosum]